MAFDVEGARKEGYSETEIADFLAGQNKFDTQGARKEGYTDADIIGHLQRTPEGIDWEDVGKSAASRGARGAIGVAGLPGDIGSAISAGADYLGVPAGVKSAVKNLARLNPITNAMAVGPTSEALQENVEGVTGPFYDPKTEAGKVVGAVAEFAPGALLPGGVAARAANVVLPGVASEGARLATKGSAAEPYAQAAGGLAGGMMANKTARALTNWTRKKTLPTDADIAAVKKGLYDTSDQATIGNPVNPLGLQTFGTGLKQQLNRAGMRPSNAPTAHGVIDDIMNPNTGQAPDVYDLVKSRVAAKDLFAKGEGKAAKILLDELDQTIDVLSPTGIGALRGADREHSIQKTLESVNKRLAHVQRRASSANSGQNLGNQIRSNLTSLRNSDDLIRGLKPDEIAQIDRAIAGNFAENFARKWSNRLGGGGGVGQTALIGGSGGLGYGLTGDPVTGVAVGAGFAGLGMGLRGLSNKLTMNQARKLEHMVRARSAAAAPGAGPLPTTKLSEKLLRAAPYGVLGAQAGRDDEEFRFTDPPKQLGGTRSLLNLSEGPSDVSVADEQRLLGLSDGRQSGLLGDNIRVAEAEPSEQQLLKIRLNQMLYDRNLSRKSGVDTNSAAYGNYNAKIRSLREQLKGMGP